MNIFLLYSIIEVMNNSLHLINTKRLWGGKTDATSVIIRKCFQFYASIVTYTDGAPAIGDQWLSSVLLYDKKGFYKSFFPK